MKYSKFMIFIGLSVLGYACSLDDEDQKKKDEENAKLRNYVNSHSLKDNLTTSGIYFVEKVKGTGETPTDNDFVKIEFDMYHIDNWLIETTNHSLATSNGMLPLVFLKMPFYMSIKGLNAEGLRSGLKMMKEGGEAQLIVPSDYAYGGNYFGDIPPYSTLRYEVKLLKVIHDPELEDRNQINGWVDSLGLEKKDSTAKGYYYKIDMPGLGNDSLLPDDGDSVYYEMRSGLLNGMFISGDTLYKTVRSYFPITNDFWPIRETLQKMKPGGKARLIVPYKLLPNGANGAFNYYYQVELPIYSSMYYDIKLNKVSKKAK